MALEVLSMDFSATVIGSAVSVVVVVISYVIYKIGIGEKSFEEVIEEQKRRSIEEEMKQKSEKVKKEKKFKKTWGKKSKERTESEISPETAQSIEMKDVDTDIEIIEPKEIKTVKQKNKPKSAASNQLPSDVSVLEKNKKGESSPVSEKSVAEKKKAPEVEKVKVEPKVESPKQTEIKENTEPLHTQLPMISVQSASQPAASSHKKKKKEHVEKDIVPITASKLLSLIKESDLEAEEIQNLIDVLLNKQKDTSSWTKINDPLALTKKNLHEKEQLLDQELRQNQVVTTKLKDLREEYNGLKAKLSAQEKLNAEKVLKLQQDIQTLTSRTKQMQDQLTAEKEKLVQVDKENEKKIQVSVKSLEEEKAKLLQKISKLETESRSGISKTEYETIKKSREELQKVHTLLVDQHTQLVSKEKNQHAQLADYKTQVEKLASQNRILSDECKSLKDSVTSLELAKRTAEDKLKAEEIHHADLEIQVKQLSSHAAENAKLKSELSDLRLENERLTDQLVTTKERVAGDGQEIVHHNGELNGKHQEASEKLADEKDKLLNEKESLLVQINDDLSKQKAKVALLSEEIEVQKQKNNELREKNWKAMEALTNAEKNAEQRIKDIQIAADQKIAQYENISNQVSQSQSEASSERLKKAEHEAAQSLSDYHKELEKNRQLSSEIFKLNNTHKSSLEKELKNLEELKSRMEDCQSKSKECLQRICPNVSVSSSLPFEKWLLEFEQQALVSIKAIETQSTESSENLEKLLEQKENEYLQKQIHYEQVLAETESSLSKLQKSAESQHVTWQERLKAAELELEQMKQERDALATEKEAMQSTFQQISQLEELQEKLKLLQSTLENAESERSHLEQKCDEVQKNCLNLRDQLENKERQIIELQKESNSVDRLSKEIEELKSKLEKEKKISKDFSSQMIRLNSLVKIGQDALNAEQDMVKKLKAQLEAAQVSTANGTATTSPVTVNESQTKIKNPEKSKKRMDASDKK